MYGAAYPISHYVKALINVRETEGENSPLSTIRTMV